MCHLYNFSQLCFMEEEIFVETFVKNVFANSAVKNKYVQKSGNFWNYKFSIGQK